MHDMATTARRLALAGAMLAAAELALVHRAGHATAVLTSSEKGRHGAETVARRVSVRA